MTVTSLLLELLLLLLAPNGMLLFPCCIIAPSAWLFLLLSSSWQPSSSSPGEQEEEDLENGMSNINKYVPFSFFSFFKKINPNGKCYDTCFPPAVTPPVSSVEGSKSVCSRQSKCSHGEVEAAAKKDAINNCLMSEIFHISPCEHVPPPNGCRGLVSPPAPVYPQGGRRGRDVGHRGHGGEGVFAQGGHHGGGGLLLVVVIASGGLEGK